MGIWTFLLVEVESISSTSTTEPGNFRIPAKALEPVSTQQVRLADLDKDGDLDAFVANGNRSSSAGIADAVWLNDGFGNFSNCATYRFD